MDTINDKAMMMEHNIINTEPVLVMEKAVEEESAAENVPQPQPPPKKEKQRRHFSKVPISRVSAIMRSCPNLTTVKQDAVALTSQAAELFIKELVKQTIAGAVNPSHLTYNDLSGYISTTSAAFLKDVVPEKITVRQFLQITAVASGSGGSGSGSNPSEYGDEEEEGMMIVEEETEE